MMKLAVVERQCIMQLIDLQSLARVACACTQMRSESLHPAASRFLSTPQGSVADLHGTAESGTLGHDCPLVRAHVAVTARLDGLGAMTAEQAADALHSLIHSCARFRRVTTLALWNIPPSLSEEQALRLVAAVPLVETLWGVRTGTVFAQSKRVQEAIFRLPHLTKCGLDFVQPGGEFDPSLLALAPKLWNVVGSWPASDLSPLRLLTSLPHLCRVHLLFVPTRSASREVLSVSLPCVEEFGFGVEGSLRNSPSIEQMSAILLGMSALKRITLQPSGIGLKVLRSIQLAGPRTFPSLEWIQLDPASYEGARLTPELLAVFPGVEIRLPDLSEDHSVWATVEQRATLELRTIKNGAAQQFLSVRQMPPAAQPAPQQS